MSLPLNQQRGRHESNIHSIYSVQNEDVKRIIIHANDTDIVVIRVYYASTLLRYLSELSLWVRKARESYRSTNP